MLAIPNQLFIGGNTHVSLMDGHISHCSLELLKANNVVILGYPLHTRTSGAGCSLFREDEKDVGKAFRRSFKAVFEIAKTGVYPFSPPSPVRATTQQWVEISPTTHTAPIAGPSCNTPATPTRQPSGSMIDPQLEMPTKWMREIYGALVTTLSSALLPSKTPIMSVFSPAAQVLEYLPEMPQPDISHTKHYRHTLTNSPKPAPTHAILFWLGKSLTRGKTRQHVHLSKLDQSLQRKENKTTDDRTS
ncbi:hypothetical protein BYT27DRAFT_7258487 [Phlegmacium glaucopus]|nr:hypothetical protein BYT27DRAFT_7258487 [Phlegmacium glaucopus]